MPKEYTKLSDNMVVTDNSDNKIELTKVSVTGKEDHFLHIKSEEKRKKEKERPKREYFLRYTHEAISEADIWEIYNMTRDIEAVFRTLKTDLDIRLVYHQKDAFIEPHIWLGIIAYQVVNYIRIQLKENNIKYSWTTIVEKMCTMQSSIVSVNNDKNEKLYVKLCTRPTKDQKDIFDSLNFKHRPFVRKTKIVPQM
jgi:hypothetical protein